MPGTPATGSPDIAIVDSRIIASLCDGSICVDTSPTVYIGSGEDNVLGAVVEILNPFGIIVKPYGSSYEISPSLSGGMDAAVCFDIPTIASNYQYGKYTVNVKMTDSEGNSWIVSKPVTLCEPDKNNKNRNYGSLSALMKVNCVDGKLFVIVDSVPNYNGQLVESKVLTGTLKYPTVSGVTPLTITSGTFAVTLYEGVYLLEGEICATYNFGDNVFVEVKYKIKKEHNARCLLDECCVYAKLSEIQMRTETDCTAAEKEETASLIVSALSLFELAKLAGNCGEDPSDWIDQLEALLKCKCTCNCNEGAPIVNNEPSGDVIIEGCNVSVSTNGLTKTYTIENYEYEVEIAENGGALVVASATLANCTKTQLITFNIAVVYSQIKTLANQNNTEADFWASVIRKAVRSDLTCLGLTQGQIDALTFDGLIKAIVDFSCACCGTCGSTITDELLTASGADEILTWRGTAYSYEVWLDGVLVKTILTSAWPSDVYSCTFIGANDNETHTWLIVSRCSNGAIGETSTGNFQKLACPEIAATLMVTESLTDGVASGACPFDLTSLVSLSNPLTAEWHTANNTLEGSLVSNPASVGGGTYYVFNKDGDGCYSLGTRITIDCSEEGSCTAPQNLEVVVFGIYNFFVKFQSAAYPPPANSYTVYRRLASAADVGGSYTTIGTPVWNATLNRWVIADLTAVNNTLYVYKAESNCGSTTPGIQFTYVNAVCPTMTFYPGTDEIDYSFTPPGGSAVQMKVQLYDSSGTVLIQTDTYSLAFPSPTTGTFIYLTSGTTYKARITIIFDGGASDTSIDCSFQTVTTDEA